MTRLAKCPLCGKVAGSSAWFNSIYEVWCCYRVHGDNPREAALKWNRLARLVRKGKMFEWLEKRALRYGLSNVLTEDIELARIRSRKRRKK